MSKLKSLAIYALIALVVGLGGWLGYTTIEAKNAQITALSDANKALDTENNKLRTEAIQEVKSETVTEGVKQEVKKQEAVPEKTKSYANQYVEKKLAEIEKKYKDMEQTAANKERKETEISLERVKGLWLTYCMQEPLVANCK